MFLNGTTYCKISKEILLTFTIKSQLFEYQTSSDGKGSPTLSNLYLMSHIYTNLSIECIEVNTPPQEMCNYERGCKILAQHQNTIPRKQYHFQYSTYDS